MNSNLADKCKKLELAEAGRKCMPNLPVIARLDGRAFHTLCRGMDKPFDLGMVTAMQGTAGYLLEEFHPEFAYVQSDEITLAWNYPTLFDGRYQKLTSILAGTASVKFSSYGLKDKFGIFDCRVWQVPTLQEVIDAVVFREDDATKNSISACAQSMFSHKELQGVRSKEKIEMMNQKGFEWGKMDHTYKKGTYLKRIVREVQLTQEQLDKIPEKHRPTDNKGMQSFSEIIEMPPIRKFPDACRVLMGKDIIQSVPGNWVVTKGSPLEYHFEAL